MTLAFGATLVLNNIQICRVYMGPFSKKIRNWNRKFKEEVFISSTNKKHKPDLKVWATGYPIFGFFR